VMPSSLTDPEMASLVSYINQGKPTLIIDDPFPRFQPGLAPHQPKPRAGGPMGMMGGGPPPQEKADKGLATRLCNALGIVWHTTETVWDPQHDPHPEIRELLEAWNLADVVYITPSYGSRSGFSPDSRITRGLQEMMLFYPGWIKANENSKLKFEPLLYASPAAVTYDWDDYVVSGFMGIQQFPVPLDKPPVRENIPGVIAARISGTAGGSSGEKDEKEPDSGKSAGLNVVFVADMDMVSDPFFYIRDKDWQGLKLDNITFVLNAVDELAGERALLELRSRQAAHRTLTTVEASTNKFKAVQKRESIEADEEAKKALDDARKRYDEEVNKILADKTLDQQTQRIMVEAARQRKQRELNVLETNIQNSKKRKIKESKDHTEREVRSIEDGAWMLAVAVPPIPALILGIFVYAYRIKSEREGIVPDRLVARK
ncbi:MAG TPA: hypothetical protein VKU82_08060, partial [Planctomycetaceae bacterium]|nr:hypothetical protein [Planctomycetaceae bacterium]